MSAHRILYADDDELAFRAFAGALRGSGLALDVANGADAACNMAADHAYAVIAIGYGLASRGDRDLVHELRQRQPLARLVLVGGELDLGATIDAIGNDGIDSLMCKPLRAGDVISGLRSAIAAFELRHAEARLQRRIIDHSMIVEAQRDRLTAALAERQRLMPEILLSAIDLPEHELPAHCQRLAEYAVMLGEELGMTGTALGALRDGALLHDIGMIGVPAAVIGKSSSLTPDEWALMRRHPEIGARVLDGIDELAAARSMVLEHHERWDGTGYPAGLRRLEICQGARVIALADMLEALLSPRPYRGPANSEVARRDVIAASGSQLDPTVVEAFARVSPARLASVRDNYPEAGPSACLVAVA